MLITAIALAVAGIVAARWITWRAIWSVSAAAGIALGLSAFHFFTVLSVRSQTQLKAIRGIPEYLIEDISHLANLTTGYHVGLIYLAVLLAAIAFWQARKNGENVLTLPEKLTLRFGLVFASITLFLEIPFLSWEVWYHVAPVVLTVGTERYYIQLVLLASVLIAVARSAPIVKASRWIAGIWTVAALFPAVLVLLNVHIFPHSSVPAHDPAEYLPAYTVSEDSLYLLQAHFHDPATIASIGGDETIAEIQNQPQAEKYRVSFDQSHTVTFHQFYWPEWHLYHDTTEMVTRPDSLGRAFAVLPAGTYDLQWRLEAAPLERIGAYFSWCTVGIVFCMIGFALVRSREKGK